MSGIKAYKEKLKNSNSEKKVEKILEENTQNKVAGRPRKALKDVRNKAIPIAFNEVEKQWIDEQVEKMSSELNMNISVSAWMRMKILNEINKE